MSIALLSIPLGIISIMVFIWSMNGTGAKPEKGKKKDNDSAIIGIIVSVLLFFVSIGIFDIDESTGGMFSQDNSSQQRSLHESEKYSSQSQAQREVEEYNKSAVEKARNSDDQSNNDTKSDTKVEEKEDKVKSQDNQQNKNLEEQRQAYQKWHTQVEAKVQSIDTIWSALWIDGSPESIEKLIKALHKGQAELAEIKVPGELTAMHRQRLIEAMGHYNQWIDSHLQACQMKSTSSNQDIITEVAKGDGLKLRANVEVSNVGNELNIR